MYGIGFGHEGNSFAIPTRDERIRTLPIPVIKTYVDRFLEYARNTPELTYHVTKIGCGLAGYNAGQIAPLFKGAPDNCTLPEGWREYDGHCEETPE